MVAVSVRQNAQLAKALSPLLRALGVGGVSEEEGEMKETGGEDALCIRVERALRSWNSCCMLVECGES